MSLDHMLLWLSAKGQGSWSQFRGAVEELHTQQRNALDNTDDEGDRPYDAESDLPLYQHVRFALQRLGHVEFYTGDTEWRVVPPTVALLTGAGNEGLLCGARSPALLKRLHHTSCV